MTMRILTNPDKSVVKLVRQGLKANDGHCPCQLEHTPETKCMCSEFRSQLADPAFTGFCRCMLYRKVE